ncbi:MAG: nucleoside hydrolase-like domain-containing protein [Candidatus Thorarchaeota archaeon]
METDTQTYLWMIPNGLRSLQSPTYGGWGGRYKLAKPEREKRPIFTDSYDTVIVGNGLGELKGDVPGEYHSNQATIWRWREAYQHDFAARMDWASTSNYKDANHPPKVVMKGELNREVNGNALIELDATKSSDPDGDDLFYHWFYYKESGTYKGNVKISTPFSAICMVSFEDPKEKGLVHVILDVKDSGILCLHQYARFILLVK